MPDEILSGMLLEDSPDSSDLKPVVEPKEEVKTEEGS